METPLVTELRRLLRDVELLQAEQLKLTARKGTALREASADELLALVPQEESLASRLNDVLTRRQRLLNQASSPREKFETLEQLAERLGGREAERLSERLLRVRKVAAVIQRENRIHWIVARSAFHVSNGLLELLMHRGRPAPIYGQAVAGNGLLLDATV